MRNIRQDGEIRSDGEGLILTGEGLHEEVWQFPMAAVTKNHNWGLKTTEIMLSEFWRPEVQNQGICRRLVPSGGSEGESVSCLSWLLVLPGSLGIPWLVAASLQSLSPSSHAPLPSVSPCVLSSYKDTSRWV